MMWAEAVLTQLTSFVNWPVDSVKLDDLSQLYVRRQSRDDCKLSYSLGVSRKDQAVKSVTLTAAGAPGAGGQWCSAPLIVRPGVDLIDDGAGGAAASGAANSRAAAATAGDGARNVIARVPPKGSVTMRVSGDIPWMVTA
jgi:hypothetical protein